MLNTLIFAVGLLATVTTAAAQTTAFTYQGRLTDGGNPANGSFQMQFKLFAVSALRDADCNIAGVKYERLNILLISAVKEQQQQIEELRSKLQYMENRLRTRRSKARRARR